LVAPRRIALSKGPAMHAMLGRAQGRARAHRCVTALCTDTCAICRNKLYEPSIEAQANPGLADDAGYSIAWGCCGHVFHLDCISRWLKTRSVCPLCNREWECVAPCATRRPPPRRHAPRATRCVMRRPCAPCLEAIVLRVHGPANHSDAAACQRRAHRVESRMRGGPLTHRARGLVRASGLPRSRRLRRCVAARASTHSGRPLSSLLPSRSVHAHRSMVTSIDRCVFSSWIRGGAVRMAQVGLYIVQALGTSRQRYLRRAHTALSRL
jgi:hypothetical protein